MPAIVDREEVRKNILEALERCIQQKPLSKISLRDIAQEAGMSHVKLLYYYENRDDVIRSYVKYTQDYMSEKCISWFRKHKRADYDSNLDYMNAFMAYVANGEAGETRPNATTQTYVLGHYDPEIRKMVFSEFSLWRSVMEKCLHEIYGDEVGSDEAEGMMILIAGTFICNYNGALTGQINDKIISSLLSLKD